MRFHLIKLLILTITGVIGFLSVQFYERLLYSEPQIAPAPNIIFDPNESPGCHNRGGLSLIRYDTAMWPGGQHPFFAVRNDGNGSINFYVAINRNDPSYPGSAPTMSFYYPMLEPVTNGKESLSAGGSYYFRSPEGNARFYVVSVYGVRVTDQARFSINARYRGDETAPVECNWEFF